MNVYLAGCYPANDKYGSVMWYGGGQILKMISPALYDKLDEYLPQRKFEDLRERIMDIYLAGGITGNLREFWTKLSQQMELFLAESSSRAEIKELYDKQMELFLAESSSRAEIKELYDKQMELFLVGENGKKKLLQDFNTLDNINILESFYYLSKGESIMKLVPYMHSFLLDSGAFTFMAGSHKGGVDWDAYTEAYADFINKHDVKLFFELDIDSLVGLQEVERLRNKLEVLTGKKPIVVWHKSRGKEYFIEMCKNYPYVAIGGIVTKEVPTEIYEKAFPWFIATAHKYGAKIHGLGYTRLENLKKYHFDSVDSTAWLYGNRGGYVYTFNPNRGNMDKYQPKGVRLKSREGAIHNFNEWVKFGIYARTNL